MKNFITVIGMILEENCISDSISDFASDITCEFTVDPVIDGGDDVIRTTQKIRASDIDSIVSLSTYGRANFNTDYSIVIIKNCIDFNVRYVLGGDRTADENIKFKVILVTSSHADYILEQLNGGL